MTRGTAGTVRERTINARTRASIRRKTTWKKRLPKGEACAAVVAIIDLGIGIVRDITLFKGNSMRFRLG